MGISCTHALPYIQGPDALLTPLGIEQALTANSAWKIQLNASAPLPQKFLSSPLSRAASTLNLTWSNIAITTSPYAKPTFMEMLRESIGLHTCDQRRRKHYLHKIYPNYTFECGFQKEDELWGPVYQETDAQQEVRLRRVLNEIWEKEEATYISITAHSGTVAAILKNIGHREFRLQTGGMIPVVVRGYHDVCFLGFQGNGRTLLRLRRHRWRVRRLQHVLQIQVSVPYWRNFSRDRCQGWEIDMKDVSINRELSLKTAYVIAVTRKYREWRWSEPECYVESTVLDVG
jgi:broad specificity phosphatase PhoE